MFEFIKNYSKSLIPVDSLMEALTPIGTVRFMKGQFGKLNQVKVKVTNAGDGGHNLRHGGWIYWMSVNQALELGVRDGEIVPVRGIQPIAPEDYLNWKAQVAATAVQEPDSGQQSSTETGLAGSGDSPESAVGGVDSDLIPAAMPPEPVQPVEKEDRRVEAILKALSVGSEVPFKPVLEALRSAGSVGMEMWELKNALLASGYDQHIATPVRKRLLNYLFQHSFGHYSSDGGRFFLNDDWYFPNKRFWDEEFQSSEPLSQDYDPFKDLEVRDYLDLVALPHEKGVAFYVAVFKNAGNFGISLQKAEIQAIAHRKFVLGDYSLEKTIQALRSKGLLIQDPETELYYFRVPERQSFVMQPPERDSEASSTVSGDQTSIPLLPDSVETIGTSTSDETLEEKTVQTEVNLPAFDLELEPIIDTGLESGSNPLIAQEQIGTLRFYPNVRGGELTHVGVLVAPNKYKYIMTVKKAESLGLRHGEIIEFEAPVEGKPTPKLDENGAVIRKLLEKSAP